MEQCALIDPKFMSGDCQRPNDRVSQDKTIFEIGRIILLIPIYRYDMVKGMRKNKKSYIERSQYTVNFESDNNFEYLDELETQKFLLLTVR